MTLEPDPGTAVHALGLVIVDDQPVLAKLLQRFLEQDGHQVRALTSPLTALDSVISDPPDGVLSDSAMPGLSGWELAARLPAGVPVILITGSGDMIDASQLAARSVVDVVRKPYRLDDLRRALARLR